MVITDEPGIYEDGRFGIRIENEFIVKKGLQNKYGQFMHFEDPDPRWGRGQGHPGYTRSIHIKILPGKDSSWPLPPR